LNKENASKLWKLIQTTGDDLLGKLPNHPNHPKGRNPYAHVALEVKTHFKMTYKDIPDENFDEVVRYLDYFKKKSKLNLFKFFILN
tara:strand:- start:142 stop:399 length:258 start_codon:yes stop_codon:yes gene_type:complete